VEGGVDETTALLEQRWDHVFYTGNGRVGRVVAAAAARHLTPVTLELGGKSPAIVDRSADVRVAARRIAWGKFVNAGQTCVAPDHVLVHRDVESSLLSELATAVRSFYGSDPSASPDYGRIVDDRHFARLRRLLDAGGYNTVVCGGDGDPSTRYLAPTIVAGVSPDAAMMRDEIFGPILPVIAVDDVEAAIEIVRAGDKPLALYVFSGSDAVAERVLETTSSGGACVNATVMHLAVPELPFGGVGESGTGAYHGLRGFQAFSHRRSVLERPTRPDPSVLYPPYTRWKQRLLRRFM
jgi:aldehyde dehydrogenase (NAD+)